MSLVVSVAGQWTSTAQLPGDGAPVALGVNENGYDIGWTLMGRTLRRTDKYGDTDIERFFQGVNMSIGSVMHEWKAEELKLLTITNDIITPTGGQTFDLGVIGSQATDNAGVLVLSSVASTPARTNSFATITFHAVTVDEDFNLGMTFGPDKLVLPFRGKVWPTGSPVKFLTTA